jgi:hypothetical protein
MTPAECACVRSDRDHCPLCGQRVLRFTDTDNATCTHCGLGGADLVRAAQPTLFLAGYHTGYRAWWLDRHGGMQLRSLGRDDSYQPRQRMVAACDEGGSAPCAPSNGLHVQNQVGYGCGLYAFGSWAQLRSELRHAIDALPRDFVAGPVALYGSVWEHEQGWRAQYAYPLAFALDVYPDLPGDAARIAQLADAWAVPLVVAD